jgi:putative endonuclease
VTRNGRNGSTPFRGTTGRIESFNAAFFMLFYTYILYSEKYDRFYIGYSEDIHIRFERHNKKMVNSTKPFVPWTIVYFETQPTKAAAVKRESEIKNKKSRQYIINLIENWYTRPD